MKILWIGGWAIPIEYIRTQVKTAIPQHEHSFIHPHPDWLKAVSETEYDTIIGYSLGATLLLMNKNRIFKDSTEYLIAPFLNIENATIVKETQLKFLLKNLRIEPLKAINDFYARAQLEVPRATSLPYSFEDLVWGIETIIRTKEFEVNDPHKIILLGQNDPLINLEFFGQNFTNLNILTRINHELKSFIPYLNL